MTHAGSVRTVIEVITMTKYFKNRVVLTARESGNGWHSRGYFPHFDGRMLTQHVCFHLFDSLPGHVLNRWRVELEQMPKNLVDQEFRKRVQDYLDAGHGECFLKEAALAEIVQNALLHFAGDRYDLHAWCVMPNHVHVLFTPAHENTMSRIVHSWKSFTANKCNQVLGRTGRFWQKEPFDRFIRNANHYRNALNYIENNPVKAGLCEKPEDWRWSSAGYR